MSRFARIWGQISNAHISKTVRDNHIIMVLKMLGIFPEESNETSLEALGGRISEIVGQNLILVVELQKWSETIVSHRGHSIITSRLEEGEGSAKCDSL